MKSQSAHKHRQIPSPKNVFKESSSEENIPCENILQEWGIAETAAHFEVTTRAIRFYEDKDLLSPRRMSGKRVFNAGDRERLEKILRAKRIGFSLEDIKLVLEVTDGKIINTEVLLTRKTSFEAVIERLRRKRDDIDIIAKDLQNLCAAIDSHIKSTPNTGVFQFADAYQAKLHAHMDDMDKYFHP